MRGGCTTCAHLHIPAVCPRAGKNTLSASLQRTGSALRRPTRARRVVLAAASQHGMDAQQLDQATKSTIGHYDQYAERFWEGTKDHDVTQNREALLRHLPADAPCNILDFGCGPGRDLIFFKAIGHEAVGLDGSARFCEMAREKSGGCEVLHQNMLELKLPTGRFDGIFANASLFHCPTQELPRVLGELHAALKTGGVLFASNPRGENQEGFSQSDARYGAYWDYDNWHSMLTSAGFVELEHYYRPPGKPRDQQPWLASVWRRQ